MFHKISFVNKSLLYLSLAILLIGMVLASSKAVIAVFVPLYIIQFLFSIKSIKTKAILVGIFLIMVFSIASPVVLKVMLLHSTKELKMLTLKQP